MTIPVGCSDSDATIKDEPGHVVAINLSDGSKLAVVSKGPVTTGTVDVSGLNVDLKCAQKLRFSSPEEVRTTLLRKGCAAIVDSTVVAENEAEDAAKKDRIGRWDPGVWTRAKWFLERNWIDVTGIVLGILGLTWIGKLAARLWARRNERRAHVILLGLPGSGKTDLWIAWRDDSAPRSDSAPTVGVKRSSDLTPVIYGKYTLMPRVVDAAGSEPWHVINQLNDAPWRSKRILVFVVGPRPEPSSNSHAFSHDYVVEQKGYASLPRAVLGSNSLYKKPHLVVMFASKFDLVSNSPPGDTSSQNARSQVDDTFREHRNLLQNVCKRHGIPFVWIVGSAKRGWGVGELRDSIRRVVSK
ncbi:GTPase domain-containing protein [Micromonospora sp. CPCC 205371]|nr:GTPase domain-containing protein [Micromonospora sp. CPCC 205371]